MKPFRAGFGGEPVAVPDEPFLPLWWPRPPASFLCGYFRKGVGGEEEGAPRSPEKVPGTPGLCLAWLASHSPAWAGCGPLAVPFCSQPQCPWEGGR